MEWKSHTLPNTTVPTCMRLPVKAHPWTTNGDVQKNIYNMQTLNFYKHRKLKYTMFIFINTENSYIHTNIAQIYIYI